MNNSFFQSVLIKPPIIMGVKLHPFSAYHALCLMQFDSPFLAGGFIKDGDIILALMIMRDTYKDNLKSVLKFCNNKIYSLFWEIRIALLSVERKNKLIKKIDAHIEAYTKMPKYWNKGGDKTSGIPWPFRTAALIWNKYNCSESYAWDMPLSRAACYRALIAEENGVDVIKENGLEAIAIEWLNAPNCADFKHINEYIAWKEGKEKCQN